MKYIVQYGAMRQLGVFSHVDQVFRHGHRVIVRTPRGQEVGVVRCEADQQIIAKLRKGFIEDQILRLMTEADEAEYQRLQQRDKSSLPHAKRIIQEMKIAMDLVRIEHVFGGGRIVFYYTAEERVDFRELVKMLTAEFHTRVEMRQISSRDAIKLLHCFGDCGRELCCSTFLHETPTITIKMAKIQLVTLDPSKISGHCGRLKCCLRYEYDSYAKKQSDKSAKTEPVS